MQPISNLKRNTGMKQSNYEIECTDASDYTYFSSVTAAADHFGVSPKALLDCLNRKRPTVIGICWRWADVYSRLRNFLDGATVSPPTP